MQHADTLLQTPYVVAGPCSAESPEQVLRCAEELVRGGSIQLFRAGVWKPRTRPGGFEGRGAVALPWLAQVQRLYAVPVCVEVATPEHVSLALEHSITSFWVGARTSSDPFAVEALARAIPTGQGAIFVKNPISPDLELWVGAIERFACHGHTELSAVLRGFYPTEPTPYRNAPLWDVALALRSRLDGVRLLCDPSHIAGQADLVGDIAQRALDLSFDGLFVEVHPDPSLALSDAQQQLTPQAFWHLMAHLHMGRSMPLAADAEEVIQLRETIDRLDARLLDTLAARMETVAKIGDWKSQRNIRSFDGARWRALLRHHTRYAAQLGLRETFVRRLFSLVHGESLRLQGDRRRGATGAEAD